MIPVPRSKGPRRRVLEASRRMTAEQTAARFCVSVTTMYRLRALQRKKGSLAPKDHRGGRKLILSDDDRVHFKALLAEDALMTIFEMAARFSEATGRAVSRATVGRKNAV